MYKRKAFSIKVLKGINDPVSKTKKIEHNLDGFNELLKLRERIKKEYNSECIVVFESTGIYHKSLQTYLDEYEFKYVIISPLLSAKVRKSDIRGTKIDAKVCSSIAEVFYLKNLRIYSKVDEMKRWKIEFRRLLDLIYPGFDKFFNNVYVDYIQELLTEYPHPDEIKRRRLGTIAKFIQKHTCHNESFALKKA